MKALRLGEDPGKEQGERDSQAAQNGRILRHRTASCKNLIGDAPEWYLLKAHHGFTDN